MTSRPFVMVPSDIFAIDKKPEAFDFLNRLLLKKLVPIKSDQMKIVMMRDCCQIFEEKNLERLQLVLRVNLVKGALQDSFYNNTSEMLVKVPKNRR